VRDSRRADDIEAVDCADPSADYRVTSGRDDAKDGEAACADNDEATSSWTVTLDLPPSSFVLCLVDLR
jgi:hypothetical protein